ncbi:MAG: hypothetical protein RIR26_639 [Pseudomonadota bacterium]|jgi:hypothetical protein
MLNLSEKIPLLGTFKKRAAHRNALFVLMFALWVVVFVFIFRQRWLEASRTSVLRGISSDTTELLKDLETKTDFWATVSTKIGSQLSTALPTARSKSVMSPLKDLLESHDEWVATHVYRNKKGSQPVLLMTFLSRKAMLSVTGDKEFSVPWPDEAQLSSLRLISNFKSPPLNRIGTVRAFKKGNVWTQLAQRRRSANRADGDIWIVHTLNDKFLPFLNGENPVAEIAILNSDNKEFLFSKNFSQFKIESNELISFIENQRASSGVAEQKFISNRKSYLLTWARGKRWDMLQALPSQKVNSLLSVPAFYTDWTITLFWLAASSILLLWSMRRWFWEQPADDGMTGAAPSLFSPPRSEQTRNSQPAVVPADPEREFCKHLLSDIGPIGELKLAGSARARIEVASAGAYKGSWWLLENIDEHRICVTVGDASGKGLAAGTAAFSTRCAVERCLKASSQTEDSEILLSKLFSEAHRSTETIFAGTTFGSIFICVIDVAIQKIVFINAGYPSPQMTSGAGQRILLNSSHDPMGLGADPDFSPRWVNITVGTEIVLCNVGSRNTDLSELEDSELVKVYVYPLGFIPKSQMPPNSVFEALDEGKAA